MVRYKHFNKYIYNPAVTIREDESDDGESAFVSSRLILVKTQDKDLKRETSSHLPKLSIIMITK